jgi:anti-sigma B factor antagonist
VSEPPFSVDVDVPADVGAGSAPLVKVTGELDFLTAPRLRSALLEVLAGHPGDVVVDLTATTFMDSIGMSVLIQAAQRLRAESAALELRPRREVRKVLDVAGVSPLFRY